MHHSLACATFRHKTFVILCSIIVLAVKSCGMSEEASKHKRKAKTEDGPDKKVKLEATSSTFEVQPEVEVIAIQSTKMLN